MVFGCKNTNKYRQINKEKFYYIEQPCKPILVNNASFIIDEDLKGIENEKYFHGHVEGEKYSYMILFPKKFTFPNIKSKYRVHLGCQDLFKNGEPIDNIEIYEVLNVVEIEIKR